MDFSVLLFLFFSFGALIAGFLLEGGKFLALFIGTAALIVFGGTIGAVGLSFPMEELNRLPKILGVLLKYKPTNPSKEILLFHNLSLLARSQGILSLENGLPKGEPLNPLVAKGISMVVDGVETQLLEKTLVTDAENRVVRHEVGIAIFEAAGGYSPTMGIIGTVMGLVHVLGNLEDPSTLGPKIAVAFIATLYGVATANLVWLPIASRLRSINDKETLHNEMIIEGLLSLQQGKHPKMVVENMCSFLSESERQKAIKQLNLGD